MKRFFPMAITFGVIFLSAPTIFAGQIENLDVTPAGSQILIEWDKLTDSEMFDQGGGYVIQYSTVQNDIRNDKSYRNQRSATQNTLTLRAAGFERDKTYYFRIYSLKKDGRKKFLNNGSKILKWEWKTNGDVSSEFVAANDPVIVDNSSSENIEFNFGKLRAEEFDKSIHFKWSRPGLSSSDYDGFVIVLSKNDDLSSPVAEVVIPKNITTSFVEGLSPSTQYYATGYFKNGSSRFGKSETVNTKTLPVFTSRQNSVYTRRVLKRGNLGIRHNLDNSTASTTTNTTTTESTSTTTTSATPKTTSEIKARITELRNLIKKYQKEIRSLEQKTSSSSSTSSSRSSRSTRSSRSSGSSSRSTSTNSRLQALRDRLKRNR
jgi:hypothetical protein